MEQKIIDWVPLTKWSEHFRYPSQGAMRNICARRKDNGAEDFLSLVNGRFYIHLDRFNQWMEQQTKRGIKK